MDAILSIPRGIAWLGCSLLALAAPVAAGQSATLAHSDVTETTATITISGHTAAWWHQSNQSGATCASVAANVSAVNLGSLSGGTSYVWKAYSDNGCAVELASTSFTTISLTADDITSTTATLNLANNAYKTWSYQQTSPSGPACRQDGIWGGFDPSKTSESLTGLSPNTTYTFTGYFGADCAQANKMADVSFTTPSATLAVSNVTKTTATLTISGHGGVGWWYQGNQSGATCGSASAGTSSANLAGLTVGTEYTYKAYNASGCAAGQISSHTFSTQAGAPGAPSDLAASKTYYPGIRASIVVRFSWTQGASNGASISGTVVRFRRTSPQGSWTESRAGSQTELSYSFYSDSGDYGKAMEFQVRAVNSQGDGAWSASSAFTVSLKPGKPAAPAVTSGYRQLGLSWSAPDGRGAAVTGYDVQYRAGNSGSWTDHAHSGAGTSATITGLNHIAAYQVRIRAANSQGDSEWSDAVSAGTKSGKVKDVRVVGGNASLDVGWAAQSGASSYKIQWKSGSEDWDAGRQETSTTASKSLTGLTNGTDYVVRVAAVFSGGDAVWSDAATGRPTATPSSLKATAVSATGATLTLTGHTGNWWVKGVGGGGYSLACAQAAGASHGLTGLGGNRSYEFAAYSDSACADANELGAVGFTTPGSLSLAVHDVRANSAYVELHGFSGRAPNWSHRIDTLGDARAGPCRNHTRGASVHLSLRPGANYTAHGFNGLGCADLERFGSVTFATPSNDSEKPQLSVSNIGDNGATLTLSNHTGDWWYDRGRNAGTCTAVPAGTTTATLSGLSPNTTYFFTAYSDPRCAATDESIAWESMRSFTTTGSVAIAVSAKTATGFTVTLSGYTQEAGYPRLWAVNAARKLGDGGWDVSRCQVKAHSETSAVITGLQAGQTYSINIYKRNTCNFHTDVISASATTTSLSGGGGNANSASLTLNHHDGAWSYRGGAVASQTSASTSASAPAQVSGVAAAALVSGPGAETARGAPGPVSGVAAAAWSAPGRVSGVTTAAAHSAEQCHAMPAGTYTANLDGLSAETRYAFTAWAGTSCAGAELGRTSFTTPAPGEEPDDEPAAVSLAASALSATSARLRLANHSGAWWYRLDGAGGADAADSSACAAAGGAEARVSGLAPGASHGFTAYSAADCAADSLLASASARTPALAENTLAGLPAGSASLRPDLLSDLDGDGVSDFVETLLGTDPLAAASVDLSESVLDVLVLHTAQAAAAHAGDGELKRLVEERVDYANAAFAASGVRLRLRAALAELPATDYSPAKPDNAGNSPAGTGDSPAGTGDSPAGTGNSPAGTGNSPAGTGSSPTGTGDSPAGTGNSPAGTGNSPAGTGNSPAGTGNSPTGTGNSPAGTDNFPAGTGGSPASETGNAPLALLAAVAAGDAPAHVELRALRARLGADLVVFAGLAAEAGGSCGMAYQNGADGVFGAAARAGGWSWLGLDCAAHWLARGVGHNLGLAHARGHGGVFDFSAGHGAEGAFATIMADPAWWGVTEDQRLPLFSNPDLDCGGQACGVGVETGAGADAARSLNITGPLAADWFLPRWPWPNALPASPAAGLSGEVEARIALGALSGGLYRDQLRVGDTLDFVAEIEADPRHVGLAADFHLLVRDQSGQIAQFGADGRVTAWDGSLEGLLPLRTAESLAAVERFYVVRGLSLDAVLAGLEWELFLAYRAGGELVYAANPSSLRVID